MIWFIDNPKLKALSDGEVRTPSKSGGFFIKLWFCPEPEQLTFTDSKI